MTETGESLSVTMVNEDLSSVPQFELAPEFRLHWYEPGDAKYWLAIHEAADPFNKITPELFQSQFVGQELDPAERQFYLMDESDEAVATATAWGEQTGRFAGYGRLHWVAVVPGLHGRGIGRMIVSIACQRMLELGHTHAMLETDTRRPAAIHLYERFGFCLD